MTAVVMLDAWPYGWMEAGNLFTSLASLSPEFLALARSVSPLASCYVNGHNRCCFVRMEDSNDITLRQTFRGLSSSQSSSMNSREQFL